MRELHFKTEKLLPFTITGATTLGEVLNDSRTAAIASQIVSRLGVESGNGEQAEPEANALMMQSILAGIPLKTLISSGAISGEQVEGLIEQLNACCV